MEPIANISVIYDCREIQDDLDRQIVEAMALIGWGYSGAINLVDMETDITQREIVFVPRPPSSLL